MPVETRLLEAMLREYMKVLAVSLMLHASTNAALGQGTALGTASDPFNADGLKGALASISERKYAALNKVEQALNTLFHKNVNNPSTPCHKHVAEHPEYSDLSNTHPLRQQNIDASGDCQCYANAQCNHPNHNNSYPNNCYLNNPGGVHDCHGYLHHSANHPILRSSRGQPSGKLRVPARGADQRPPKDICPGLELRHNRE
ncbi:g9271 [Coccomyxa elongata]